MSGSGFEYFVRQSNAIEGIYRDPTAEELVATKTFIDTTQIIIDDVIYLQNIYAPGKLIRDRVGMNVRVGDYVAPIGGPSIPGRLSAILARVWRSNPWQTHVAFEKLHPFMDGNGRTGRALWAWHMKSLGMDPFALSFLHQFYYQTLATAQPRKKPRSAA